MKEGFFRRWWTAVEWSVDANTGARARIEEVPGGWNWAVRDSERINTTRGFSVSQRGARAACRRVVKKIKASSGAGQSGSLRSES